MALYFSPDIYAIIHRIVFQAPFIMMTDIHFLTVICWMPTLIINQDPCSSITAYAQRVLRYPFLLPRHLCPRQNYDQ